MTPEDLKSLLTSWIVHLRAERKSDNTIKNYENGVRQYLAWAADNGCEPDLDKPTVRAWIAQQLDDQAQPASVRARLMGVRQFSVWLAAEREIPDDRLIGLKPPKLDTPVIPELTDDEVRALIKACTGKEFLDRRDEAIVRLMLETAARAGEVVVMELSDLDLKAGTAIVRRGKGGKGRRVPIGPKTCQALDRYIRLRRAHRLAGTTALWLGDRGKTLAYQGLYKALKTRAEMAGLTDFFPHVLRHTGAGRWLAAGGSEGGLMAVAGWSTRDMIDRYTKSTAQARAAEEAKRLNLGDI